jgi:hypothetical protein
LVVGATVAKIVVHDGVVVGVESSSIQYYGESVFLDDDDDVVDVFFRETQV